MTIINNIELLELDGSETGGTAGVKINKMISRVNLMTFYYGSLNDLKLSDKKITPLNEIVAMGEIFDKMATNSKAVINTDAAMSNLNSNLPFGADSIFIMEKSSEDTATVFLQSSDSTNADIYMGNFNKDQYGINHWSGWNKLSGSISGQGLTLYSSLGSLSLNDAAISHGSTGDFIKELVSGSVSDSEIILESTTLTPNLQSVLPFGTDNGLLHVIIKDASNITVQATRTDGDSPKLNVGSYNMTTDTWSGWEALGSMDKGSVLNIGQITEPGTYYGGADEDLTVVPPIYQSGIAGTPKSGAVSISVVQGPDGRLEHTLMYSDFDYYVGHKNSVGVMEWSSVSDFVDSATGDLDMHLFRVLNIEDPISGNAGDLQAVNKRTLDRAIAAGSLFKGSINNAGTNGLIDYAHLPEANQFNTSHYYTVGSADVIAGGTGMNTGLNGTHVQPGWWLQSLGSTVDASGNPIGINGSGWQIIKIDTLSKLRADSLYGFKTWVNNDYEGGALVTNNGKIYRADKDILMGSPAPHIKSSDWTEVDLTGVSSGTVYLGKGDFDSSSSIYNTSNNWGMPSNTYPQNRKPHDGDAFLDINTDSTVIFHVDNVIGTVSVQHEYGHTRNYDFIAIPPATSNGTDYVQLPILMSPPGSVTTTSIYDIEIVDTLIKGTICRVRLVAAADGTVMLFPLAIKSRGMIPEQLVKIGLTGDIAGNMYIIGKFYKLSANKNYKVSLSSPLADLSQMGLTPGGIERTMSSILDSIGTIENYPKPPLALKRNILSSDELAPVNKADYEGQLYMLKDISGNYYPGYVGNASLDWEAINSVVNNVVKTDDVLPIGKADHEGQLLFNTDVDSNRKYLSHVADAALVWQPVAIGNKKSSLVNSVLADSVLFTTQVKYDALTVKDDRTLYLIEKV